MISGITFLTFLLISLCVETLADDDFATDCNGHLKKSYLVYTFSPACKIFVENAWKMRDFRLRTLLPLVMPSNIFNHSIHDSFNKSSSGDFCAAACIDAGTPLKMSQYLLPEKYFIYNNSHLSKKKNEKNGVNSDNDDDNNNNNSFNNLDQDDKHLLMARWIFASCQSVEVGVINLTEDPV